MTFLELCKEVRRKCAIAGNLSSVVNQSGEFERIINWVNEAYDDIQTFRPDWAWMHREIAPYTLTVGQAAYTPADLGISSFGAWEGGTLRLYRDSLADEVVLRYHDPKDFFAKYSVGYQTNNRPTSYTVGHDSSLKFGAAPDFAYTINAEYYKAASQMTANTDIPAFPAQYHRILVYRAMMLYGAYEDAGEVYNEGRSGYETWLQRLEDSQLHEVTIGAGAVGT